MPLVSVVARRKTQPQDQNGLGTGQAEFNGTSVDVNPDNVVMISPFQTTDDGEYFVVFLNGGVGSFLVDAADKAALS